MERIKEPAVAGSFYPKEKDILLNLINGYKTAASTL